MHPPPSPPRPADIEYNKTLNPRTDGDALVGDVVARVLAALAAGHGVRASPDDVLELDASSHAKFSRHVTVRAPGAAMASTAIPEVEGAIAVYDALTALGMKPIDTNTKAEIDADKTREM